MKDFLLDLANSSGLGRVAERLEQFMYPALRAVLSPDDFVPTGGSRFGGLPDLPLHRPWPTRSGIPLDFLAQIRCADVADSRFSPLPAAGLLSFFYDIETSPWGVRPSDRDKFAVLHIPDLAQLQPTPLPGRTARPIVRPSSANFVESLSLPALGSKAFNLLGLSPSEQDAYFHFLIAADVSFIPGPFHQLFGHPKTFQGDVPLDCQLVSNGVYLGDARKLDAARVAALAPGAADWRMLLQIDSDPHLGLRFGDNGLLSFWVREADLRVMDFNRAWAVIQSP